MKEKAKRHVRSGFTMAELIAVLIIVGLLAAVVVSNFVGETDRARVRTTKLNLKLLHQAINRFRMDSSRLPAEDEGLSVLVMQPADVENWPVEGYLDTTDLPVDGWGREFLFQLYPESGKPFVIISYGRDGVEGGEGYDADLYSTDAL